MNSDLMHAASVRLTQHNTGLAIVAQLFKRCRALFAFGRHFADADLVAHHLNRLLALDDAPANKLGRLENCRL